MGNGAAVVEHQAPINAMHVMWEQPARPDKAPSNVLLGDVMAPRGDAASNSGNRHVSVLQSHVQKSDSPEIVPKNPTGLNLLGNTEIAAA
jgi:hypothetical protein